MPGLKLFAAGLMTETNTFSPAPTALDDFRVLRGSDVLVGRERPPDPNLDLSITWGQWAQDRGDAFVFSLMAHAQPFGITVRSAYETLRDEILKDLEAAMPVDIVLLNLHGAMVAQGYDDCEEDLIRRVRSIAGPKAVIGVELDPHCHLSPAKIEAADLVITYKEYPHVDVVERARELFDLAVAAKLGHIRPTMALFDCRMVGIYPTTREPFRGFVETLKEAEQRPGVLSLSYGHGFPFADVPHLGAKMLAITDGNPALAQQVAAELGRRAYELRAAVPFESLSVDEALSRALRSQNTPVVVADQSDNPGGGAPGDSTFALRWLLDHQAEEVALAIFYDPEVVKIARKAGAGAQLWVRLGGKLGPTSGDPVDLEVTVLSVREAYFHAFPQQSGEPILRSAGDVVALRCGSIDIVVSSERCQCFSPSIFSDLGIDPAGKRLLIPKSTQHFHAAFAAIAGEILYMAAPGALAPDPKLIPYRRLPTHDRYPWVSDPING